MPRRSTKTKAAVAVRSSKRLIERASSPVAPAEVAVGKTPTKRKAGGAPAGAPGLKRVRASPHARANAKTKILAAQTALKSLELSVGKTGTEEEKKAKRDLIKRCIEYQEDLIKRIADGALDLKKLRSGDKDGDKEYEVVELLNARLREGIIEFLVLFQDFPLEDSTWEPMDQVDLVSIQAFLKLFPKRLNKNGKPILEKGIVDRIAAAEESKKSDAKSRGSKAKPQVILGKGKVKKTGVPAKDESASESESEEEQEKDKEAEASGYGSESGSDSDDEEAADAQLLVVEA